MKKSNRIIESPPEQSLTDSEGFENLAFDYGEFSGLFSGGELEGLFSDSEASNAMLDSMINSTESLSEL